MKKTIHKLIVVLFTTIISMSFLLCGCGNNKKEVETNVKKESAPKKDVVLKLEGGDWGSPNPYLSYPRGPGSSKVNLIYDSLIERDEKGMIPWLAEKWEVKNGGKEYLFKIRKGVKWQDGKEFTPEDVKFSFEYFKKHPPVSKSLYINGKCFIDNVEVLNDNYIKVTVNTINASSLDKLGNTRIIPKHIWEKVNDPKKFNEKDAFVGCGPYTLESYNKERGAYKFTAFKDYWGPKQRVKSIEFIPVSDPILAFEKGDLDLIEGVKPDIAKKYENNKDYKQLKGHNFFGYRLCMNMDKKPEFKDKNIRQAIAYSIDQQEIIDKVKRGLGVKASASFLPKDHVWYNKYVKKYDYNPSKSKELLKDKNLSFELTTSNRKDDLRMAELIKLQLEKTGIKVNVKSLDMKSRDAAAKTGNYEALITSHGGWGQDADILRELYRSKDLAVGGTIMNSIPGYKNQEIDKLCDKQMNEMNEAKRKKLVYELQEKISDEIPMIPIINTPGGIAIYKPAKYDGYMNMYNHFMLSHSKLSYLERK
ncbi:diguanylate phosphodiesterase [Clostridium niameyense]|uniref:Diguanylate phosphodiesterase n=1 Tax=Clostridium niameyense TaxID=1622073 RepID=A0A6M0R7D1_9CLOT|nr:ABC transporter substrate-binding protein [Clostridium niameyense]NEZ46156.1 diguanylate phosphodiesterase [Clostridium niameyense]